jgi:hypothetical protein
MRRFPIVPLVALLAATGWGQSVIRLKSRTIDPRDSWQTRDSQARGHFGGRHFLLQFDSFPRRDVRDDLTRRGVRILEYVPDNALMVSVPSQADWSNLGVRWAGRLEPSDKISRAFARDTAEIAVAMFFPDADMQAGREAAIEAGLEVVEEPWLLPNHLLVVGDFERIERLAEVDDVEYIIPADRAMLLRKPLYVCPGPITEAGAMGEYVLEDAGWSADATGHITLGYFFDTVTAQLPQSTVESEVERAFSEWSRYANVDFTAASEENAVRSIDILFASGAHGDAYPFTSTSVLAHTFYPVPSNPETIAGDMHFNNDESWTVGGAIDLYSVALHETGHALGLGHSDLPTAVMYPYYQQETGLTSDDIAAVQALYGARSGSSPAAPSQPAPTPTPAPAPTPTPTPTPAPTPTGPDTVPPSITIVSPAATIVSTSAASIAVSGSARDNVGVVKVTWSNSTGSSGTASGTTAWSANVPLLVGDNTITMRAYDAAGNSGWRAIMVVRN